jgi:ATP-dependent RNA helicase DeaD
MTTESSTPIAFRDLGLPDAMLQVLSDIGYETPSPIQAETIPLLLAGRDVLGQAQTGTGKTAAFALPILSRLDMTKNHTQVLVLAPTRELAIQVAEAFQTYARHIKNFHVLPIYGGTDYRGQLRSLKQGAQVVVGTPGRIMDHMRRGTLNLSQLQSLVLDEADEMLRMGFIDDVEWILEQTPAQRQIALFSATMPREVRRIAQQHLNNPAEITITVKTTTAPTIRQRYWPVSGMHKLDALTRILEAEEFDGMLVFVRTKIETVEITDKLRARGYNAAALNGDIVQAQREKTVNQLKKGGIDILVATDVAARGLDVERISHVINYDIPVDTEAYVHRIGRTGRAGRQGDAILFVSPREKRMLFSIEKATRQPIERMELPTTKVVNEKRITKFKQRIAETIENLDSKSDRFDIFREVIMQYQHETGMELEKIAAALAVMAQDGKDLLLKEKPGGQEIASFEKGGFDDKPRRERPQRNERSNDDRPSRERPARDREDKREPRSERPRAPKEVPDDMERFRIDVGHVNEIKPGNIVGAIANEADLDSQYIGHIAIHDEYSTVDLPKGMPKATLDILRKARVAGRPMNLRIHDGKDDVGGGERKKDFFKKDSGDKKPYGKKFSKDTSERSASPFRKEGFKKEGFKKESSGRDSSPFKKEGFRKESPERSSSPFKKEGFKKEGFRKDFKKADGAKPAFKKDGFKKDGFKKKRSSDD